MKQAIRFAEIALVLICLAGCIQVSTVIKVKPDGSGTIEETLLISKAAMQQIEQATKEMTTQMGGQPGGGQVSGGFEVLDENKLRESASQMGEGVTYVSSKKVTTKDAEGYRATFAFSDINKVRLDTSPSDKTPSPTGMEGKSGKEAAVATFRFEQGPPAVLVVTLPEELTSDNLQPPELPDLPADDPQMAAMTKEMKEMFKDMKVNIALEVEGDIVRTNATHREGSKITLMEVDFGKLMENEDALKKINQLEPRNIDQARKLLKDVPGIKVEFNPELRVEFGGKRRVLMAKEEAPSVPSAAPTPTRIAALPEAAVTAYDQGAILYMYGNPQAAIHSFQKVLKDDPQNPSALYSLGISYENMGQYEDAISSINRAIELNPEKGSYYYGRGHAHLLAGEKESAVKDFKQAASLGDEDAKHYLERMMPQE
jgi:TolA-binding protein